MRVVVRYRLPDGRATDVVGELVTALPDALVVRSAGTEVRVPAGDVVAARAVPPRPARRGPAHLALAVPDLEDVMSDGWRAVETGWLGGRGGWLLRASEGFTGRGNSALPLAPPPSLPHDAALRAVRDWYAARGLPATVALPEALPGAPEEPVPGLRAALETGDWRPRSPTVVMVGAARAVRPAAAPAGVAVSLDDAPDDGWLALYRYRGQPLPPVALRLLLSAPRQVFASARTGSETVAVGRLAVSRGWGGITAMEVAPPARRRGLGRAVLAVLARQAALLGAPSVYLQVAEENEAARSLYAGAGFTDHHRYAYWTPAG